MAVKAMAAMSVLTALAWGFPTMSFAYGKSHALNEADTNFVRDDLRSLVIDKEHGKMYTDGKPVAKRSYKQAEQYCRSLKYAGFSDWRLPSKEEMVSLLNNKRRDVTVKQAFRNVLPEIYWTSTAASHGRIWYVDFDLGRYSKRKPREDYRLLCVRDRSGNDWGVFGLFRQ